VVESVDDDHCTVSIGGDSYETVAALIVHAGLEFTLLEPADLVQPIRDAAERLLRGTSVRPASL
jgi:predicted DNA-binding transcriptional regulator YafY